MITRINSQGPGVLPNRREKQVVKNNRFLLSLLWRKVFSVLSYRAAWPKEIVDISLGRNLVVAMANVEEWRMVLVLLLYRYILCVTVVAVNYESVSDKT